MANQASKRGRTGALSKPRVAQTPRLSARTIFLKRPMATRNIPRAKFSGLNLALAASRNCGTISHWSAMGPWLTFGKKDTKRA
ncbi:MAG TPA: hypothetical protein PLM53_11780 [Spirochaetota bacterium]|nr:hypothetical protein [Spirochaetota bacterium]